MTSRISDATTVFVRQALPNWRAPWGLVFGMLQPLVFLVFFGPLLVGTGDVGGQGSAGAAEGWMWFVPAVLVMLALFGTTGTGYMLLTEIQTGSHERLLVTPINRTAMLVGRTLNDVATLIGQAVLVVVATLPFGLRPDPVGALASLALLAGLGLAVGALSHALAIALRRHQEMFYMVQSTLLFPLLFLSGLMLPLDYGPAWMQAVGRVNPLTHVVDSMRALFIGQFDTPSVFWGTASVLALAVVGLALGTHAMQRAST